MAAQHFHRCNVEVKSLCDLPAPAPIYRAALSALVTAELEQLSGSSTAHVCLVPTACLLSTRTAPESHGDRPAPVTTWRAALSAWPAAADRAHFQADQGIQGLHVLHQIFPLDKTIVRLDTLGLWHEILPGSPCSIHLPHHSWLPFCFA